MKRQVLALIVILSISSSFAIKEYASADMSYTAEGSFDINHLSDSAELINMSYRIHLYPENAEMTANRNENLQRMTEDENDFFYGSHEGDTDLVEWKIDLNISREREFNELSSVPSFPYSTSNFPEEILPYLEFGNYTDISNSMIEEASEIVSGSENYIDAIMKLAEWVNTNMEYDASNAEAVQGILPASTVFQTKNGVCDEYAALFISLCRAIGIPAKYIYGYAYSNNINGFGPHAWAEVYVPNYGWISFDVTEGYGEYGWLDATHIKMSQSRDVTREFIEADYLGYEVDYLDIVQNVPDALNAAFDSKAEGFIILNDYEEETKSLSGTLEFSKTEAGENDYILMTIKINNPTSKYIPLSYIITTTSEMEIVDNLKLRGVLLQPNSETESHVILKTPEGNFGHPVSISAPNLESIEGEIIVNPSITAKTSLEEVRAMVAVQGTSFEGIEIENLSLSKSVVYGVNPILHYEIRNEGNTVVENLEVDVYSGLTETFTETIARLNINQLYEKDVELNLIDNTLGEDEITMYVSNNGLSTQKSTNLTSAAKPEYTVEYVGDTKFAPGENVNFTLLITNTNQIEIASIHIVINANYNTWDKSYENVGSLIVPVTFDRNIFGIGDNNITVGIAYIDNYGTMFTKSESFIINVEGSAMDIFLKAIVDFFKSIGDFFIKLFNL